MKTILITIGVIISAVFMIAAFIAAETYINSDEYEGKDE